MTSNQIAYAKYKEEARHNRASEFISKRDLDIKSRSVDVAEMSLDETKRHNLAGEVQAKNVLLETTRHNVAGEKQAMLSHDESVRHNKANEDIALKSHYENVRHNQVVEAETERSHRASESIGRSQVSLGYAQLAETSRANQARERETVRSNLAHEAETVRSHKANEGYQKQSLDVQRAQVEIAQQNADSQRISAEANVTNAETRQKELNWRKVSDFMSLGADIYDTNAKMAGTLVSSAGKIIGGLL